MIPCVFCQCLDWQKLMASHLFGCLTAKSEVVYFFDPTKALSPKETGFVLRAVKDSDERLAVDFLSWTKGVFSNSSSTAKKLG